MIRMRANSTETSISKTDRLCLSSKMTLLLRIPKRKNRGKRPEAQLFRKTKCKIRALKLAARLDVNFFE